MLQLKDPACHNLKKKKRKEDVTDIYIYMCVYIYIYIYTYIYTYIYNRILVIKRKESFPLAATWMDFEGIMLSEISQTEKDKYCMISFICVIPKTQQTSE